jgi:hypothetical protein
MQAERLESAAARLAVLESARTAAQEREAALRERLASAERTHQELVRSRRAAERRALRWGAAAIFCLAAGVVLGPPQAGQAQGGTLEGRIGALETKLARVLVVNGGDDIVINGANLQIVNGMGDTQTNNGLGNLTIGYNEARGGGQDERTGSHNLVLGQRNNYTSYGGIVGGFENFIVGPFSAVITGTNNVPGGHYGFIATGDHILASGHYAAGLGGQFSNAAGFLASITGGFSQVAGGFGSVVSGGWGNQALRTYASVSGGDGNSANGDYASVSGGSFNVAQGVSSAVSGGVANQAMGVQSTVSGGYNHTAAGEFDWRAGSLFQDQ